MIKHQQMQDAFKAFGSFQVVGEVVEDLADKAYDAIAYKQI